MANEHKKELKECEPKLVYAAVADFPTVTMDLTVGGKEGDGQLIVVTPEIVEELPPIPTGEEARVTVGGALQILFHFKAAPGGPKKISVTYQYV